MSYDDLLVAVGGGAEFLKPYEALAAGGASPWQIDCGCTCWVPE